MRFSHGVVAFGSLLSIAHAAAVKESTVIPGVYVVEFEADASKDALYDELRTDGLTVEHRQDLSYSLFNGASFRVDDVEDPEIVTGKIFGKNQVKAVWPVKKIKIPTLGGVVAGNGTTGNAVRSFNKGMNGKREVFGNDTYSPHVMTQVDRLRAAGITGKGIKVGVVDTGVDYRHPALGGCFGEGCLVSYGYDLVGDFYYSETSPRQPKPDPLDTCQGHGTHVSGIIMAQENELGFTGAAPDVTFGMYKVSGCSSFTTSELLLEAFLMAYEDGSDVISCSVGDDSGWATDVAAVAASRIADKGVSMAVAIGNSGGLGPWQAASPASGVSVSGIGSVDNTVLPTVLTRGTFSNSSGVYVFGWRDSIPAITENVTLTLWAPANETLGACGPMAANLTGTIALLKYTGACRPATAAQNILLRGGKYALFYVDDESQFSNIALYNEGVKDVGVGAVTPRQSTEWLHSLRFSPNKTISVSIGPPETAGYAVENFENGNMAGYTSTFSSWGPTWETELKPQFTGPGGWILSTWTWDQGAYAVNPGTSMSTPFVAAVFALVSQARKSLDSKSIRNIIAATSQPKQWHDGTVAHEILASVAQQGAGLVQAYDAAFVKTIPSTSGISLNDTDNFVGEHSFTIKNTGTEEVTYTLGHNKAVTVLSFTPDNLVAVAATPSTVDAWATIAYAEDTITVPAGASGQISFTAAPPSGLNGTLLPIYSGYLTIQGSNGDRLSIPYLGVAASLKSTEVIQPGVGLDGVYLSTSANHFLIPSPANTTFTIPRPGTTGSANAAYPKIVALPRVGATTLRIDLVAAGPSFGNNTSPTTNWFDYKSLGLMPGMPIQHAPIIGWTGNFGGSTADKTVLPAGAYAFVVSALRIFGNAELKEDWDFVQTVPFNLQYLS